MLRNAMSAGPCLLGHALQSGEDTEEMGSFVNGMVYLGTQVRTLRNGQLPAGLA